MGDLNSLQDLLPIYYKRLFPYGPYFKWLSYGNTQKNYFENREFSFNLADDIYLRYLSFSTIEEFQKELIKKVPHKIDIGAVFNFRPKDHKTVPVFQPKEKELVIDIDMTDYDDVRTCCSGAEICDKCWKFMTVAVKILDVAFREDFGWEHLLWVFSGRRGIHCWVCDASARALSQRARAAVADYLTIVKGGENMAKKVTLPNVALHPMVKRAADIVTESFPEICLKEQDILDTPENYTQLLAIIPDEKLRQSIVEDFSRCKNSVDKWKKIEDRIHVHRNSKQGKKVNLHLETEIQLQYMYPRLDVNVTKGLNHLLKSPFCVHPKTGKVCVPIDPKNIDRFNPTDVPTISELLNQLDENSSEDKKTKEYQLTSLKSSVTYFNAFIQKMERSWKEQRLQNSDEKMEF